MEVTHRISFQIGKEFEQHTAEFKLGPMDVNADAFGSLNLLEKMFVLNSLVLLEGLLFQLSEGYIGDADYKARKDRILSLLNDNAKKAFKDVLGAKNGNANAQV